MRKMFALAALAASVCSAPAFASPDVSTTVSASSSNYNGSLAYLTDGVIPANESSYNDAATEVYFTDAPVAFTFDFGGLFSIDELMATVDNNDNYNFQFFNGTTQVGPVYQILSGEGSVGFGVETFTRVLTPYVATSVIVTASAGDARYSLGEVRFRGNLVNGAVPEPATWAMMLLGFAGIGVAARRQRKAALLAA